VIPQTINKMNSFECVSALQKAIRRNMEREAVHFALEMSMTSKAFCTRVLNRLLIIAHEDVGLGDPQAVMYATMAVQTARDMYDPNRPNLVNVTITNAVRALCRAQKSRSGNWLAVVCSTAVRNGEKPVVEDWMLDKHTSRGKRMGRGFEHFLEHGLVLVPSPERPEPYEEEAIAIRRAEEEAAGGGVEADPAEDPTPKTMRRARRRGKPGNGELDL
jgi:replication-associated recombination protein RarA